MSEPKSIHGVDAGEALPSAVSVLRSNWLLVLGCIVWWCSHFALSWNATLATSSLLPGEADGRFVVTIVGTVVMLAIWMVLARRSIEFRLTGGIWAFVAFAICGAMPLAVFALADPAVSPTLFTAMAAVSGVSGGIMLMLVGELHARIGYRHVPLALAVESAVGVALFMLLSLLPMREMMLAAAALAVAAAALLLAYERGSHGDAEASLPAAPEGSWAPLSSLVAIAVLTGFSYGLVRSYSVGLLGAGGVIPFLWPECLGTCISIVILLLVYVLQSRQTLFEQCLLFVLPFVAAGMLMLPMQGASAPATTILDMGGFVTYFNLMWYFAAVLASRKDGRSITFLVAALFFASQLGQLVGAMVPPQFDNALSSALVYLLVLASTFSIYFQAKGSRAVADKANVLETELAEAKEDAVAAQLTAEERAQLMSQRFDLSPREAQIAVLLCERVPYRAISEQLFISDNTVKTHVRNIYKKVGVTSREELLSKAEGIAK